jgi:hypothetical protein
LTATVTGTRELTATGEGIQRFSARRVAAQDRIVGIDDDAPARELRLGFDTEGRLLEIVVLLLDDDAELVIHAMKARPQYFDLLPKGGNT